MAVLNDQKGPIAFAAMDAYGANEDYCDRTYPWGQATDQATGDKLLDWNTKCKKSCSGLECVSKPGLLASPWTIVGKAARGLPDSSLLGATLSLIAKPATGGGAAPAGGAAPVSTGGGGFTKSVGGISTNTILLVGALGIGAAVLLKSRSGGKRRRGLFAGFSGYSKKNRAARRRARRSKRGR